MSVQSTAVNKFRRLLRHCLRRPHDNAAIALLKRLAVPLNQHVPDFAPIRRYVDNMRPRKYAQRRARQLRNRIERARIAAEHAAEKVA